MGTVCHPHYTTFARLHRAGPGEAADLRKFAAGFDHDPLGADWASALNDESYVVFLALEGATIAGAIAGYCDPARVTAELGWIGVAPSARRRGIGRLLLEHLSDALRARGAVDIELHEDDPAVSALLLACGGHLRGARAHLPLLRRQDNTGVVARRTTSHG